MLGEGGAGINPGILHAALQVGAHDLVVEAPAVLTLARQLVMQLRPVGVVAAVALDLAEGVMASCG